MAQEPLASIVMTTTSFAPFRRSAARIIAWALALATVLALLLATPGLATESAPAEGAAEEGGKITFPSNPHDQFGLVLFGLMGVAALAVGVNVLVQLRGQRPQADGKIRWR